MECSASSTAVLSTTANVENKDKNVDHEESRVTAQGRMGNGTTTATATATTTIANTNEKKDSFNTADIQALFVKYPGLRAKLGSIYGLTLDPNSKIQRDGNLGAGVASSTNSAQRTGRAPDRRYERAWNPEKGFEKGLEALKEAIDTAGPDAKGLEEFLKLVGGNGGGTESR